MMGGLERAPHAPLRSGRPGEPGTPLENTPALGASNGAPMPPDRSGQPGGPGAPLYLIPLIPGMTSAAKRSIDDEAVTSSMLPKVSRHTK